MLSLGDSVSARSNRFEEPRTYPKVDAMNLGWPEILLILGIALLLFGATKLPKLARSMGRSVGEFKAGLKDDPSPRSEPAGDDAANSLQKSVDAKK